MPCMNLGEYTQHSPIPLQGIMSKYDVDTAIDTILKVFRKKDKQIEIEVEKQKWVHMIYVCKDCMCGSVPR